MVNILLSEYSLNESWARPDIEKYIEKSNKVVIIPFSFAIKKISNNQEWQNAYGRDNGLYYPYIVKQFLDYGIAESNINWINYFTHSIPDMKTLIEESDILFLTGGLPDMAVERVVEKDLLESIKEIKVVIGASAGALMQLKKFYVSPDEDYSKFLIFDGLGLVDEDFHIEVHYENSRIQNKYIQKILKRHCNKVLAIKQKGGIIIDNGEVKVIGEVVSFYK